MTDARTMRERLIRRAIESRGESDEGPLPTLGEAIDAQENLVRLIVNGALDAILDELANPTPAMVEAMGQEIYGDYADHAADEVTLAATVTAAVNRAKEE
jgi:hypothetical protein